MALKCGCTPDASGYGYCGECTRALRKKIWKKLTPGERNYDRQFGPDVSAGLDAECCSCHICPPCSYCVEGRGFQDTENKNSHEE